MAEPIESVSDGEDSPPRRSRGPKGLFGSQWSQCRNVLGKEEKAKALFQLWLDWLIASQSVSPNQTTAGAANPQS